MGINLKECDSLVDEKKQSYCREAVMACKGKVDENKCVKDVVDSIDTNGVSVLAGHGDVHEQSMLPSQVEPKFSYRLSYTTGSNFIPQIESEDLYTVKGVDSDIFIGRSKSNIMEIVNDHSTHRLSLGVMRPLKDWCGLFSDASGFNEWKLDRASGELRTSNFSLQHSISNEFDKVFNVNTRDVKLTLTVSLSDNVDLGFFGTYRQSDKMMNFTPQLFPTGAVMEAGGVLTVKF